MVSRDGCWRVSYAGEPGGIAFTLDYDPSRRRTRTHTLRVLRRSRWRRPARARRLRLRIRRCTVPMGGAVAHVPVRGSTDVTREGVRGRWPTHSDARVRCFPSRQYRYDYAVAADVADGRGGRAGRLSIASSRPRHDAGARSTRMRYARALHDPFAQHVLFSDESAASVACARLLAALGRRRNDRAAQLRRRRRRPGPLERRRPTTWSATSGWRSSARRPGDAQPDILISASTDIDSRDNFLQVIGWDAVAGRVPVLRAARRRVDVGRQRLGRAAARIARPRARSTATSMAR